MRVSWMVDKWIRGVLILIFSILSLIICPNDAFSQVTVKFSPIAQYSVTYENLWNLIVFNSTPENVNGYLNLNVLDKNNKPLVSIKSERLSINPGTSLISSSNIIVQSISYYDNEFKETVTKSGRFPSEELIVCIELIAGNNELLSKDCKEQGNYNFSPPRLNKPEDEAKISDYNPLLRWMPPKPLMDGSEITYKIRLTEIFSGQSSTEAIEVNPVWFEESDIQSTSVQYPTTAKSLEVGKKYSWQVQAYLNKSLLGSTEVWEFEIEEPKTKNEIITGSYATLKKNMEGEYYKTERYLLFSFNNPYTGSDFDYNIKSTNGEDITPKRLNLIKKAGDNRYIIDLKKYSVFKPGEYYYLEIHTSKAETFYLMFKLADKG